MLIKPKGYKFWKEDANGKVTIDPDAPNWAKKEFESYRKQIKESGKLDKNKEIHSI